MISQNIINKAALFVILTIIFPSQNSHAWEHQTKRQKGVSWNNMCSYYPEACQPIVKVQRRQGEGNCSYRDPQDCYEYKNTSVKNKKKTKKKNISVKNLVLDFYSLAFQSGKPIQAAHKYLRDDYIQHNPHVADGKQGFIEAFKSYKKNPKIKFNIKRVISKENLVMVHTHVTKSAKDPGTAVVDIFRVENGLIAEHWDVIQKIPSKMKHKNGMI